jgi:hypothetical protein
MKTTLTGDKLRITINSRTRLVKFYRFCHNSERYNCFATRELSLYGPHPMAVAYGRKYICEIEGITDERITEERET